MASFRDRIRALLGGEAKHSQPSTPVALPFRAGDRVIDTWGKEAVVTEIDPTAEHGLGRIRLRYDDGRELSYSVVAHDLRPIAAQKE